MKELDLRELRKYSGGDDLMPPELLDLLEEAGMAGCVPVALVNFGIDPEALLRH